MHAARIQTTAIAIARVCGMSILAGGAARDAGFAEAGSSVGVVFRVTNNTCFVCILGSGTVKTGGVTAFAISTGVAIASCGAVAQTVTTGTTSSAVSAHSQTA